MAEKPKVIKGWELLGKRQPQARSFPRITPLAFLCYLCYLCYSVCRSLSKDRAAVFLTKQQDCVSNDANYLLQ